MERTKLCDRILPPYTRGEDIANMVTHIVGGGIGIVVLVLSVIVSAMHGNVWGIVSGSIYGASMIILYSVSSVYHGLKPSMGKKVMQVIDHCTIYFLIAGTYTPILLSSVRTVSPILAWVIFALEWGLASSAAVFTAIDHEKYKKLSMSCYIGMGWCIVLAIKTTVEAMTFAGFMWILGGGVMYTVGAILYGIGKKKPIFHTVFHVLTDVGSVMQAIGILFYAL